jgi:diguanylate cyclase (GGDEF)-like protein
LEITCSSEPVWGFITGNSPGNEIAIHDAMTGLYNHIHIVDRLTEEINRVTRSGAPLSIMILDVDHFKQINDTYGHITGDQVITKVSQTIKTNSRSIDLIGRYGGDEILIILPETTAEIAKVSGKRLLEKVRDLEFSRQFSVTCSAGISQFENGDTVDSLIEKADQSLYQAKDAGRDRVYICNPEVN